MNTEKLARKGILKITPYIPGKSIEEAKEEVKAKRWIKIASNENLLGPSPKALKAIMKELPNIHLYPEASCAELRNAIAKKFKISSDMIVISNGVDNVILLIGAAFVNEGEEVIMADPTFPVYTNVTQIMGGKPIKIKLKDFRHDLEGMLKRVNKKTKLVFICNPNNPTGTIISKEELDKFLSKVPDRVIVILDEAYGEFVNDPNYPQSLDYVKEKKQLIVLRTFSKVYGLAGLRIGYAIGRSDLIRCLYQVRDPFPVHRLAQVAAVSAINDRSHIEKSIKLVSEGRQYFYRELKRLGFNYVESQANFVFIDFGIDSGKLAQALLEEGIIIRPGKMWGYSNYARVTIGRMKDNQKFIKTLEKLKKKGFFK